MKIELLSPEAQEGLRKWAQYEHDDEMLFDAISGNPEHWAWRVFQLRVAEDRCEWFPKGKFATIQVSSKAGSTTKPRGLCDYQESRE